ncbi:MAG: UDP-N-acetylmuramate dehydrogenase [Kiritimatiellae bacterium]|nr:UDP-N-acetylmuramate dehydrogenase [Kiritimatiellia bacterium]
MHLMGVCGVGMAGVAFLLSKCGWKVSGCDAKPDPAIRSWLESNGVPVARGQDGKHVSPDLDCLIATPAVVPDAPERQVAAALGLPVFPRGEVLARFMSDWRGIAVCGSHGKTSTSCFITRLLQLLDAAPAWCIGGYTRSLGAVAGISGSVATNDRPALLVAESDESDGTLSLYHPALTVVNAIDLDHLDHFHSEEELLDCFRRAVRQTREGIAVCADSERALRAVADSAHGLPVLTFGTCAEANLRATDIAVHDGKLSFRVCYRGTDFGGVTLPFGGRHNALNALAAAAAAYLLGYKMEQIIQLLSAACNELPGRRFETVVERQGTRVIADYAHHPVELRAAVEMARELNPSRLIAVFQPHRYSRTKALLQEFPSAFVGCDELILLPVYAASEPVEEGGEIHDLYAEFRRQAVVPVLKLGRSVAEVWRDLRERFSDGTLILLAGAGDIIEMASLIRADAGTKAVDELPPIPDCTICSHADLKGHTFYRCGGIAHWLAQPATEEALVALVQSCRQRGIPYRVLGMGANSWFSDLEEDCCVINLRGAFGTWRMEENGLLSVPCGCSGPALLDWCERNGWSGLEFMDSIPGSIGGWLAMNAGAFGHSIGETIFRIRCLQTDGKIVILEHTDCGFQYRRCEALASAAEGCRPIALSCEIRLVRATPETVRAQRGEYRRKRIPLAGLRTEGSVFRNPEGRFAGKLLQEAGANGMRIGGAFVTDFHGNIIAVDSGVTASDVLALVQWMRGRVEKRFGVRLVPEIDGLEEPPVEKCKV